MCFIVLKTFLIHFCILYICKCECACVYAHACVWTYVCVNACICVYACLCMCVHAHILYLCVSEFSLAYFFMQRSVSTGLHTCASVHVYVYFCVHSCLQVFLFFLYSNYSWILIQIIIYQIFVKQTILFYGLFLLKYWRIILSILQPWS